jgi:pyridoxine 4-dehydrogenase
MSGSGASAAGTVRLGERTVHRLGLGTNRLTPTPAADALLVRARELGIDFLDTADVYQSGSSETALGRSVYASAPEAVIATKGGMTRTADGRGTNGQPDYLRKAVGASLDRLHTETIELYQLHRVDPAVPIETSVQALRALQEEGRIRSIGLCNVTLPELERARRVARIVSVQNRYNLLEREHEDLLPYCEEHSIAFLPWTPIHRGDLNGSPELREAAARLGATPAQVALRWLLRRSPVMLPIPGTLSVSHLEENLAAAELSLDDTEFRNLSRSVTPGAQPGATR